MVATGFALFVPAATCWPAVDSAFYDALRFSANLAMQHGIGIVTLKLLILLASSLLIFYAGIFNRMMPYRVAVFIAFSFMLSINFLCYFQAVRHMQWVKNSRFPVTNCIDRSIAGPANLVFLLVPRYLAVDHIVWNKDMSNKIFYQARTQIENPSDLVFRDYESLKKDLKSDRPTYFISQCLTFCGAKTIKKACYGLDVIETSSPENLRICGFNLDFGAPYTHYMLKNGWSGNEGGNPRNDGPTFVWATGRTADMNIYLENVDTQKELCFRAMPYPKGQSVSVFMNGKNAGDFDVKRGWQKYCAVIHPGQLKKGKNSISFRFKYAKSPAEDGGKDKRELAMAFDWLSLEDFTETH